MAITLLVGCSILGDSTVTPGPQATAADPLTSGTVDRTGSASSDELLALSRIVFGERGFIELVNVGEQAVSMADVELCTSSDCLELPDRDLAGADAVRVGPSQSPGGDGVVALPATPGLGPMAPDGGEVFVVLNEEVVDQVSWGESGAVDVSMEAVGIATDVLPATGSADWGRLPLRDVAQANALAVGVAVRNEPLDSEAEYRAILGTEFNVLVPEHALKFDAIHPEPDSYDFGPADRIIEFGEEHGMAIRGHTLVWHDSLPDWVTEDRWSRDELETILRDHILTVAARYAGQIDAWDVVNEAVDERGRFRESVWQEGLGPDYIEKAFFWAREADPDARLFYNDYEISVPGPKADGVYELLQDLLDAGVPVDGVGFQVHLDDVDDPPSDDELTTNIRRFGSLGLEVHITEFEVGLDEPASAEDLEAQASIYRRVMGVCLAEPNCTAFVMWGMTDKHTWLDEYDAEKGSAHLFDEDYEPKPAYYEVARLLAERTAEN